jgi:hypothetical protein
MTRNRCYSDEPYSTLALYGKTSVKYQASHCWNAFILNPPTPDFNCEMSFVQFKSYVFFTYLNVKKVIHLPRLKVMTMFVISHVLMQLYVMFCNYNIENTLIKYAVNFLNLNHCWNTLYL